jgi:hypothetical protein
MRVAAAIGVVVYPDAGKAKVGYRQETGGRIAQIPEITDEPLEPRVGLAERFRVTTVEKIVAAIEHEADAVI